MPNKVASEAAEFVDNWESELADFPNFDTMGQATARDFIRKLVVEIKCLEVQLEAVQKLLKCQHHYVSFGGGHVCRYCGRKREAEKGAIPKWTVAFAKLCVDGARANPDMPYSAEDIADELQVFIDEAE